MCRDKWHDRGCRRRLKGTWQAYAMWLGALQSGLGRVVEAGVDDRPKNWTEYELFPHCVKSVDLNLVGSNKGRLRSNTPKTPSLWIKWDSKIKKLDDFSLCRIACQMTVEEGRWRLE
jgi:hypothetical protein